MEKIMTSNEWLDEYRKQLSIDKNNLDKMLIEHPVWFGHIAEQLALAVSKRDRIKDEVELVRAQVDKQVRTTAADEAKKITETQVLSAVEIHVEFRSIREQYLDQRLLTDQWFGLKEAFVQRSYMLKELIHLYLSEYWDHSSIQGSKVAVGEAEHEGRRRAINTKRRELRDQ